MSVQRRSKRGNKADEAGSLCMLRADIPDSLSWRMCPRCRCRAQFRWFSEIGTGISGPSVERAGSSFMLRVRSTLSQPTAAESRASCSFLLTHSNRAKVQILVAGSSRALAPYGAFGVCCTIRESACAIALGLLLPVWTAAWSASDSDMAGWQSLSLCSAGVEEKKKGRDCGDVACCSGLVSHRIACFITQALHTTFLAGR